MYVFCTALIELLERDMQEKPPGWKTVSHEIKAYVRFLRQVLKNIPAPTCKDVKPLAEGGMQFYGEKINPEFLVRNAEVELCERDIIDLKTHKPPGWKTSMRKLKRHVRQLNNELQLTPTCE